MPKTQAFLGMVWISKRLAAIAVEQKALVECCTWLLPPDKNSATCCLLVLGEKRCLMKPFERAQLASLAHDTDARIELEAKLQHIVTTFGKC